MASSCYFLDFFQVKYYLFQSKVFLKCCIYQCTSQCITYLKLTLKENNSDEHHNYSVIAQTAAWLSLLFLVEISAHIFKESVENNLLIEVGCVF